MKKAIVAFVILCFPTMIRADLTNIAQMGYQDATGASYSLTSNTVIVAVQSLSLSAPILDWPPAVPIQSTLQVRWDPSLAVSGLNWTFAPVVSGDATPAAAFEATGFRAPGTLTFPTPAGSVIPAQQGLTVGRYNVTVQLMSGTAVLSQATQSLALVNSSLSDVRVYPNPWRSDRHAGKNVTFTGLTLGTTLRLFTMSGREIKEFTTDGPSVSWDLTEDSNKKVASGIYIYLIVNGQEDKVKGKVAIIK